MKIVHYPHPALRHPGKAVTTIDKELRLQIGHMMDCMYDAKGLGLAAPQVALPFQLLVMNITGDPNQKDREEVYVNPVIVDRKGSVDDEEGCLSFPGLFQKVRRAKTIKIQAYDLKGQPVEKTVSDLEARAWQHEIDHLNGVLFIDKMGLLGKIASRGSLKSFEHDFRSAGSAARFPRRPTSNNCCWRWKGANCRILTRSVSEVERSPHLRFGLVCRRQAPTDMRLLMMGTGTFAAPTLEKLLGSGHQVVALVTQPDRAVGQQRGSTRLASPAMKNMALAHNIPVLQPESVNTPEGVAAVASLAPDLLVVAAYGQILSRDVLAAAAQGGINIHASLLPKYRGAAPIAWAIYHGETRTGVSIIRMSIHLDAGDVLCQGAIDILPDETAGELETRLGPLGASLALETVERIAAGPVTGLPQDKALVSRAPKLTKEHGLIDWTRPGRDVCNQIRAMSPWPMAYTFMHSTGQQPLRVIIHKAAWRDHPSSHSRPGDIVSASGQLLVTAGGATVVEILEVQPAGKRRMNAGEFLRGRHLTPGDRVGE